MAVMAPSVLWMAPTMIVRGVDSLVSVDVERNGVAIGITGSPTLAVYDEDGTALSGSPFSATLTGRTFSATVPASATSALTIYSGSWLVMLQFEISGEQVYTAYNSAALVRSSLNPPVGVNDLQRRFALLRQVQTNGLITLQGHIDDAWSELVSKLYADECPFWTVRSPSSFRPWLLARSMEIALRDAGATLAQNNPYTREADRIAALLPELYTTLQLRLDDEQANALSDRSSPVVDTRRRG